MTTAAKRDLSIKDAPQPEIKLLEGAKLVPLLITVAVGLVIWFLPPPEGIAAT